MKAHKIEKYIDQYLKSNSVKVDGVELISLLVTRIYLKLLTNRKPEQRHKILLKKLLVLFNSLNKKKIIRKQNFKSSKAKYLFVISYPINDTRNTSILINIIEKLDKKDCLILTDHSDVYKWCEQNQYNSLLIQAENWVFYKKVRKIKATFTEKVLLSREIYLYINALKLLKEFRPRIVLTIQDFYFNDQAYTLAAKKLGIKTITHQHGLLSVDENPFLFKYTLSDHVMVWGQGSYNIFSKWLDSSKLTIVGTNKFSNYANINKVKRKYITIGINPIPEKQNIELLQSIITQLKSLEETILEKGLTLLLKLHPQLSKEMWDTHFSKILKQQNFVIEFDVLKKNNKEVLEASSVLIACKSTISLEGFLAQTSVIELSLDDRVSPLFNNIPQSVISLENLGEELTKRIENTNYNQSIIELQNKSLDFEIDNHNGSENEIKILQKITSNEYK